MANGRPVLLRVFLADRAGAEAHHGFHLAAGKGEQGAHGVRGVVHGGKAVPVVGPARQAHVLLVGAAKELDLAQLSLVRHLLDEEELARVHRGFHHHVDLPGFLPRLGHLEAFLDRRGHGDGAARVLSRLEGGDGHGRMGGDRGDDVDGVDLLHLQHVLEARETALHLEHVPDLGELRLVALADRVALRVGMLLVQGDELRPEAETDNPTLTFLPVTWDASLPWIAMLGACPDSIARRPPEIKRLYILFTLLFSAADNFRGAPANTVSVSTPEEVHMNCHQPTTTRHLARCHPRSAAVPGHLPGRRPHHRRGPPACRCRALQLRPARRSPTTTSRSP